MVLREPGAARRFDQARAVLFAPLEASRSWSESADVALAFVAAGRWSEAFAIADRTPDVHGRTLARLALLARWHALGLHRDRSARWAPALTTVLGDGG